MELIIQSYLKTFLKHWVSTLGTLLFIIMLACVVLGLMSTPLQLESRTQWARSHSTSYDWEIDDDGINFSESFAFDYFALNGYSYTAPIDDNSNDYLLNPWKPEAKGMNPDDLKAFLEELKRGNVDETVLANLLLTPSFYLYADGWAKNNLNNIPKGLENVHWSNYFQEYLNPNHNPSEKLFMGNFLLEFSKFITKATQWSNFSATTTFTYSDEANIATTAKYFVNDFDQNVKLALSTGSAWFNFDQQLYLYNQFLIANNLSEIKSIDEWKPTEIIASLSGQENLTGLAIQIFNPEFRNIIVSNYQNNVESYLVANTLTTSANPYASENGKSRYEIQSKLGYSLSEVIPGNFTPSFSTDVRAIGNEDTFNHVLIDKGREPVYDPGSGSPSGLREIVISPSFLKENKLKIGDKLTLPKASFAENIYSNDLESQDVAGTKFANTNTFVIVGTGFAYDELTPGSAYWSFVQPLKDYTYSYLPNNYIDRYQKAAFLYSGSVKKNPIQIDDKVKNILGNENPYNALMWRNGNDTNHSYGMFKDATDLVTPFSKLSTVASLNTIKIQLIIYITLGLVSLLLAFVFINFIIKKEINETRRQLGIFKSFGYGIGELSLIFATKTLITITIGIIIGWVCSIPLQFFMAKNFSSSVMFNYQRLYLSPALLITLFVVIPILFTLVAYLLTISYLREPALSLINNRQKMPLHKPHYGLISRTLEKHDKGFKYRLSGSFVKTSIGKFVTVQILFGFSALLYTLIFGARTVMYQVINQGFSQINSKTDHEYTWNNRNSLTINDASNNQYTLQDINNWDQDKINYIDYKGYDSIADAMNDENNPAINQHLNSTRYSFRAFFDALSDSVVDHPPLASSFDVANLENWWLMPESIALERYASGVSWNPDITNRDYYLYKTLLFKGADYKNTPLNSVIEKMKATNQPYSNPDNVKSPDFAESWIDDSWTSDPTLLLTDLKKTFLGLISEDSDKLTNNFFLTDLSRLFAMVLAENYVTTQLQIKMQQSGTPPDASGRYPSAIVSESLANVYREAYASNGKLAKFDPRNSLYWGFTEKNPLMGKQNKVKTSPRADDDNGFDLNNIFKDISGVSFNLLATAMISQEAKSMLSEPIINFNNLFYNSNQEQLQLALEMVPDNKEWGKTDLLLSDFNSNSAFGSPKNVYNFAGVTEGQWAQMLVKPGAPNEPIFNGILPYAIAELHNVEIGDTIQLTTKTPTSVPIKINVIAINKSVTLPLSLAWQINVDYNIFAKTMFTPELQQALGIGQTQPLSPYYFSGLVSQKPMVDGTIDVMGIGESLDSIRFVGDQMTISLAQDKLVFSSFWQTMLNYLLSVIDKNETIPESIKEKIKEIANNISGQLSDSKARTITNPMVLNSAGDDNTLVSVPYNLARIGVNDFAGTMNQLMMVFLLLQSVLLTITLIVVMNIVVDEAAVIILTLRSLGYSHNEINWIIMGPYVFWVIISFIIAYALSLIAWRVLLTYARNKWDLIIQFNFNIVDLVVPLCVLAFIMLIGWLASDYSVNRRPLTQITDGA